MSKVDTWFGWDANVPGDDMAKLTAAKFIKSITLTNDGPNAAPVPPQVVLEDVECCPACGGEGRDLRGHPNDPHPKDYGICPVCAGQRWVTPR